MVLAVHMYAILTLELSGELQRELEFLHLVEEVMSKVVDEKRKDDDDDDGGGDDDDGGGSGGVKDEEGSVVGWFAVFGGLLAQFVSIGSIYTLSVFVPEFEKEFGVSRSLATLPNAAQIGLFILLSPISGNFVQVMGPRISYLIGGALMTLTWLSVSYVDLVSLNSLNSTHSQTTYTGL